MHVSPHRKPFETNYNATLKLKSFFFFKLQVALLLTISGLNSENSNRVEMTKNGCDKLNGWKQTLGYSIITFTSAKSKHVCGSLLNDKGQVHFK